MDDKSSKNYKKYTLLLLIVTVVALVVCAASFSLKRDAVAAQGNPEKNYSSYYNANPSPSQERGAESRESSGETEQYLITVYDGKIGVYRDGESSPFLTADTDVYLLPEEDVKILKQGIRADSFTAVKGILEDYE